VNLCGLRLLKGLAGLYQHSLKFTQPRENKFYCLEDKMTLTRFLGRSGIEVSAMGMGCWAIGGPFWRDDIPVGWGEVDDNESIRAIHACIDLGVNFFDTADVYGTGHSERVLGKALKDRRQEVVIATKFGNVFDEATRHITGQDASPDYIRQACESSLQRLDTDYIDLYQFHTGSYPTDQAVVVRDTLEELVLAGKIRAYGWSTDNPDLARIFGEGSNCTAAQFQMNVLDDSLGMVSVCEEMDLAGINRGPLAMGLLTGKYTMDSKLGMDDVRGKHSPEWMKYFIDGKPNPEWMDKVDAVREILTSEGRTLVQGALAWLWGRSSVTLPIPGIRTAVQARENCKAMEFGALTEDQMEEIDQIMDRQTG
jgi:aryl-alcohol dehydrogenase-like predicted oxidoreductase